VEQQRRPIRIAIVNDYELVVAGVAGILSAYADRVEVVELDAQRPVVSDVDLVLYDSFGQVQGSDMDVDALLQDTDACLAVLSWNTQPEVVARAISAGAAGYISKGVSGEELVEAIEKICGGTVVTPETAHHADGDELGRWPGEEFDLTPRESEVLALICQGLSNQEITTRAFIGINTVKTYIRTLYAKIGAESRSQAVLWGVDHGFRPDEVRHVGGQRDEV